MKSRAYIFVASAVIAGLFLDLVPLSLDASAIVGEGLFPVLICCLLVFLWPEASLLRKAWLLAGALLLGYVVCEGTIVLRNGVRVLSDLRPGLMLLIIRFGIAFCALAVGHYTAIFVRRRHA